MKLHNLILSTALLSGAAANAAELNIEFQNLTQGIYFTPILVAAHPAESSLFETGESASDELQMMAEGGDISGLANIIAGVNGNAAEV